MGQQETPRETEEAEAATGAVNSPWPGRRSIGPPHLHLRRRHGWRIELLFKRWKGQDRVAVLSGSTDVRRMVRVWSRPPAALVRHWLLVGAAWGRASTSRGKVCEAIRSFVGRLAAHLDRRAQLRRVLEDPGEIMAKNCRRDRSANPGTFELLNDVSLLDYGLT